MTDETEKKPTSLPVSDDYRTPTVFVSQLVGSGFLNGVVNVTFGTALFTPNNDGGVDPDLVITARLRMDLFCAQQLRDRLDAILADTMKPKNGETVQ